jgi:hypothetical protein
LLVRYHQCRPLGALTQLNVLSIDGCPDISTDISYFLFFQYEIIEQILMSDSDFTTPHHSWKRGSNKNTNGLIRQYLPKVASMKKLTQQQYRPRKRLNYKPLEEYF